MHNDQEIARVLRDQCSRRLTGYEMNVCEHVADDLPLTDAEAATFRGLKTQFAREIGQALEGRAA